MPELLRLPVQRNFCEQQLVRAFGQVEAATMLAIYPNDAMGSRLLATDLYFLMGMLNMIEKHSAASPTWHYRFDYRHRWFGAAHGLELLFLWNFRDPLAALGRGGFLTGRRRTLANRLREHWISFVRNGNHGADWPGYEPSTRQTMLIDLDCQLASDPALKARQVWTGKDIISRTMDQH